MAMSPNVKWAATISGTLKQNFGMDADTAVIIGSLAGGHTAKETHWITGFSLEEVEAVQAEHAEFIEACHIKNKGLLSHKV